MEVLNVVATLVTGLMVGCELAIAVVIHPTFDKLPDVAHLPAASALARVLGTVMPFWYAIGFSLILAEAVIAWRQSGILPIWFAASSILWMLVIVYTITTLVPINNRIASWEKFTPPADWKTYRTKWDSHHRRRVALLTIAFAILVVGIL